MKASIQPLQKPLRCLAVVLFSALACGSVMAQWQWVDATGRKVYSDIAPPRNIPEKNILKRPGAPSVQPAQEASAQEQPVTAAPPAPPEARTLGVDPKLEAKRKEAEKLEEAKRQAEEDKINKARAENCERAKRSLASLKSGVRIRTTNSAGEPIIMDDAARTVETVRVEGIVKADCGAPPVRPANSTPN